MNTKPLFSTRSAKSAFSDEETVAGMDRLRVGHFGGADDGGNVEIALAPTAPGRCTPTRRRACTYFASAIGLGMHGDGLDAQLAARALDAQRDLAPVGDEDFFEHQMPDVSAWREAPKSRRISR